MRGPEGDRACREDPSLPDGRGREDVEVSGVRELRGDGRGIGDS